MYKPGGHVAPYWSEAEFNELRMAASTTGTVELFNSFNYSDRHLHAAW